MSLSKLQTILETALSQHSSVTYSIGRNSDNRIVLANEKISRYHAQLTQLSPHNFLLEDLESKHGTFVNGFRTSRKIVSPEDHIFLATSALVVADLLREDNSSQDITQTFQALKVVHEQYPELRKGCRNREKMIRMGSVILSSAIGVSAILTSGGTLPVLQILSSAGLGMLIPTLSSTILSTEEKIEILDREYREIYRCPNPNCRDPFGNREWNSLARQKSCSKCKAIWVK
ncbi:FHA domain-containing protein [Tellurirhabdus bombi]|uniref:FHA domain-containing protein n=1 Tax=Tellurirhabdus bombi TaxID=2907205 RepID=UPI001F1EC092|nr:FHA domain-containing protein [Tellurirhabdus bombi]